MTSPSVSANSGLQKFIPAVGNIQAKSSLAYLVTRGLARGVNASQMALAETYIHRLELPDAVLRDIFNTVMPPLLQYFPALLVPYDWVLTETDCIAEGSRDLMAIQYDRPQKMMNSMIGEWDIIYPKYSMGLWERGAPNLEQAQMQMIDDLIEKLDIQDGDNILDFGCGWGCIPNYVMSKFPNVRFTGLNLSHEQCEYMRRKMQDPKSLLSSGRFTLIEDDLNEVEFPEKFDKILSVGVFEHVGNITKAFRKIASILKPKGKVFVHIITVRTPNNVSSVFTHKYIFPHGRYWHYDAVPGFNQDLKTVQRWYMNGLNYHRTFQSWLENFDAAYDSIRNLDYGIDFQTFRRIWRFYLIWLGTSFACCDGTINGNGQYLLEHG